MLSDFFGLMRPEDGAGLVVWGLGHTRAAPQQAENVKVPWSSLAISDSHPCFAEHEQGEKGFPSDNQGHLPSI